MITIAVARAAAILVLLLPALALPAAAQRPTGTIVGTAVDSSGRGVPLVDAILADLAARMLTDSTGRFRFARVPVGDQRILLRAIGYDPRTILAVVRPDSVIDLGRLVLRRRVQELPTLEVAATLPRPVFHPGTYLQLARVGSLIQHAWFGASMSDEGGYLIPISWRQRWVNESVRYFLAFDPPGDSVSAAGTACRADGVARVAATRAQADLITLLTEEGVVWKAAILTDRLSGCERFTRFPLQSPIKAAASVDSGWVIVVEQPQGAVLAEVDDIGRPRWVKSLAEVLRRPLPPTASVTVTSTRSGAMVALMSPPFEWAELSHSGTVLLRGSPWRGSRVGDSLRVRAGPRWKAFGVFPIPNGYVQSIETGDRRIGWHLVYDILGRPERLAPRGVIAVVVASLPERRRLLGYSYSYSQGRLIAQRY